MTNTIYNAFDGAPTSNVSPHGESYTSTHSVSSFTDCPVPVLFLVGTTAGIFDLADNGGFTQV